ncbi:hypothetical protein ACTJJB_26080 [Chitinophaga sp. 22536]|uniref:hypothetical protein n=1 Tax=unclassified Chitinophaga TaxID=2619133 RepID=UPI003F868E33
MKTTCIPSVRISLYWCALCLVFFPSVCYGQQVPCEAVVSQTTETNGICIGCYTDNPGLSSDNDIQTYATLHVILGLLGGYTQQQLVFPSVSKPGDSIRVMLTYPVGLLDISLLGGCTGGYL